VKILLAALFAMVIGSRGIGATAFDSPVTRKVTMPSGLRKPPTPVPTRAPLARPRGVGVATTGSQCSRLGMEASACASAIAAGKLVLIWSFTAGAGPKPAGFNILKNRNLAVTNVARNQTGYVMQEALVDAAGDCYSVQAYSNAPAKTGPVSKAYCIVAPTVLSPSHVLPSYSIDAYGSRRCQKPNQGLQQGPTSPADEKRGWYTANDNMGPSKPVIFGTILVGYSHSRNSMGCGDNMSSSQYRSGISFDLKGISAKNFTKATLSLNVAQAWIDSYRGDLARRPTSPGGICGSCAEGHYVVFARTEQQTNVSCTSSIGYATNKRWMNSKSLTSFDGTVRKSSLIGFDPAIKVGASRGTMSIDVTAMVKTWLSGGRPNNGFVLSPHDPAPNRVSNTECLTQYIAPTLTLRYR